MATYYFLGTTDTDWNEMDNWWDGPDPLTANQGFNPSSSDDVVILAEVTTVSSTPSVNSITIDSGGIVWVSVNITSTTPCVVQNGGRLANGTLTGNVVCESGGIIGNASNSSGDPIITANLTFNGTGVGDGGYGYPITVGGSVFFSANWSGSASYIDAAGYIYYYYEFTGTTNNLTSANTLYVGYPDLYYNNSANDGDWGNFFNWWVDSEYTQQSATIPTSSNFVYVYGHVTADTSGSATAYDAYFSGGYTISIDMEIAHDATFTNNSYGDGVISITLNVYNNVYFDAPSTTYVIANYATIIFGNECILTGYATNEGTIYANGNFTGSTYFNDYSINNGTVGVPETLYTVDFNNNATNTGTVEITTNVNYPLNRNTFNTGTINGTINYINYPTFYFNTGSDWYVLSDWYLSDLTTNAPYIPGALDDVQINTYLNSTTTNMYAKNVTVNGTSLIFSSSYTLYVTDIITINSGAYIGDSMNSPNVECTDAIFDGTSYITGGSTLTATGTVSFNDSSELGSSMGGSGNVIGNVNFNSSSEFVAGTLTGNASFWDSSTFGGGTISGDATVYYPHPAPLGVGGTISGTLSYSGYSSRTVYFYHTGSSEEWTNINYWYNSSGGNGGNVDYVPDSTISLDDVIIEASISDSSSINRIVNTLTVNQRPAYGYTTYIASNAVITCNYANFNDDSYNDGTINQSSNHGSNRISFNDLSSNSSTGVVVPWVADGIPVRFQEGATNNGTISGDAEVYYPAPNPIGGTVTGSITYYNYPEYIPIVYFGGISNDGDWDEPNNWFKDLACSDPYNNIPSDSIPYQSVVIISDITSYSNTGTPSADNLDTYGTYPNINNINIYVAGLATFSEETYLNSGGTITGNALFENLATNRGGSITGTVTFTLSSAENMINNGYDGTYGNIEFQYGKGVNGSSILGLV